MSFCKVILVTSHKREVHGPAPILMDADLVHLFEVFMRKLWPLVTSDVSDKGRLFLKSNGAPYHNGKIDRQISTFVVKSRVRADQLIGATDFRKWIVTTMTKRKRVCKKIAEDLLTRLMCHLDKTADMWYLRESLTEQAAKASQ